MDSLMFVLLLWLALTIAITVIGSERKIGGVTAFCISALFSPIVGALVVFASPRKGTLQYRQMVIDNQKEIIELLKNK